VPPLRAVYRPEIDGLRAVSILAVVLYHVQAPGFGAGYLGVDIFFVISGFLITGQLLREAETTGKIRMGMFYARRIRRLAPAFLAMAAGTSVLALIYLLPTSELRLFGNALSRAALFYYNIAVWRGGHAYDAPEAREQVLMHTWSLGVEEQFYLVWPLVCLLAVRLGHPMVAFGVVSLASFIGALLVTPLDPNAVFFLLPFRVWELGLGGCVAAFRPSLPSRLGAGLAGLGGVIATITLLSGPIHPPVLLAQVLVVVGTAMFVAFGDTPNRASSILSATPMVFLGRMSYAWYLWHWPMLVIARMVSIPDEPGLELGPLAAGFVLALFTYLWIERPVRRIQFHRPAPVLVAGAAAITLTVVAGVAIESRAAHVSAQPANVALLARLGRTQSLACETDVSSLGCPLWEAAPDDRPAIILWGDSFAAALAPALSEYAEQSGVPARLLVKGGCPPLLGGSVPESDRRLGAKEECVALLRDVQAQLQRGPGRVAGIVLTARWPRYAAVRDDGGDLRSLAPGFAGLTPGLDATLDLLESIGIKALIVGAPPAFPFDPWKCLLRASPRCFVGRSWDEATRIKALGQIQEAMRGRTMVRYLDIFDPLCPGAQCSAGSLEEPLLADRTHITAIAARRRVSPLLAPGLDWLLASDAPLRRPDAH